MSFRSVATIAAIALLAGTATAQLVTIQIMPGTPYFEDFEMESSQSGSFVCPPTTTNPTIVSMGWEQVANGVDGDGMDWTPDVGGTGSFNTGPSVDQSPGNGTGIYLYTETSGSCSGGDIALLRSPLFDISLLGTPGFDYWRHLFGGDMGLLHTDVIEYFNLAGNGTVTAGSDQFTSVTSIFTAAHVGTQITFTSGANVGTYNVLAVISPFVVQLDTTFVGTETGIDFEHTMLHLDAIPAVTGNVDAWMSTPDVNLNAVLINAGPGIDGALRAFRAQIRGVSGPSFESDMAIDSFRVREIPQIDFAVGNLIAPIAPPLTACSPLSNSETITIELDNFSAATVPASSFPIEYTINAGPPVMDTVVIPAPLTPGTNVTHTFAVPADLSGAGVINIDITIFAGDGDNTNDTAQFPIMNPPGILPATLPFFEDFETFGAVINGNAVPPNWINDPNDGTQDWLFENSSPSNNNGPFEDHTTLVSGAGIFAYIEDSSTNDADIYLLTPCIDLTGATQPLCDFWFNSNLPAIPTQQNTFGVDVLDGSGAIVTNVIPDITTDTGGVWENVAVDLSAFIGQVIRVQFVGDNLTGGSFNNDYGIDDIRIEDITTLGTGQAPQSGIAVLDAGDTTEINGFGVNSGLPGVYTGTVNVGDNFDFIMSGEPNQAILLLTGTVLPGAVNAPPFGQLDLTPLTLAADGNAPGFINSLFNTGASGTQALVFPATSLLAGQTIGFQLIVFNTLSVFGFSNTCEITFM